MKPNRPFPIPSDLTVKQARPCVYLTRAAVAHLRGFVTGQTPVNAAKSMWGDDRITAEVLRAATGPATTTGIGWAAELAGVAIFDLVQSIVSLSAAAELIDRALQLSMDGVSELRVPGRVLSAAGAGAWVAEGAPTPARQLSFSNAAILRPRKLSVIMVFSREQIQSSNIEAITRQTLGECAAIALDQKMFSADALSASAPAGLFNGIAPITPTTGGGDTAMHGDVSALFTALAAVGGGKMAALVCAMAQAIRLKMTVGPQFDVPIIASTSLPAGTVSLVEVGSFVSGFSPTPEFRVSTQAIYHAEDTSPTNITGGVPSPAAPVRSLFQTDSVALRMDLFAAYGLRATGHVQYLTGATW